MEFPPHMPTIPSDHQLKNTSQADYSHEDPFGGIMVGNEVGAGNELCAILAHSELTMCEVC